MRESSIKFSKAIKKSIKELEDSGISITQKKVIDNAAFENGKSVGKSTLFRKDPKINDHFYKDLLLEIDKAISRQRKLRGRPTKKESEASLKEKIRELKKENQYLVDQLVSQESELIKVRSVKDTDASLLRAKDDDIYMLAKALLIKSARHHESLISITNRYEIANRGTDRLKNTQSAAEKLCQELLGGTVSLPSMRE